MRASGNGTLPLGVAGLRCQFEDQNSHLNAGCPSFTRCFPGVGIWSGSDPQISRHMRVGQSGTSRHTRDGRGDLPLPELRHGLPLPAAAGEARGEVLHRGPSSKRLPRSQLQIPRAAGTPGQEGAEKAGDTQRHGNQRQGSPSRVQGWLVGVSTVAFPQPLVGRAGRTSLQQRLSLPGV